MAPRIRNGNSLKQAMALLIQNQAALLLQLNEMSKYQVEMRKHQVELSRYQVESELRFARIERDLEEIKAILGEHSRILAGLPEAIRQKIGFKDR